MGYGVAWEAMRDEHGAEFEDRTVRQSDDVRRPQVGVADKLVSQCNGQLESAADRRAIIGQRKTDGFERPRRRLIEHRGGLIAGIELVIASANGQEQYPVLRNELQRSWHLIFCCRR